MLHVHNITQASRTALDNDLYRSKRMELVLTICHWNVILTFYILQIIGQTIYIHHIQHFNNIERKPKKIDMRIKDESVEQVDRYKYLGFNICSNLNCCKELKQRVTMAKEAFNRKINISCGSLEKRLKKRLAKCFVWSVALYGTDLTIRWNEQKRLEAFEMWI